MKRFTTIAVAAFLVMSYLAAPAATAVSETAFTGEIWADNWFTLYINGKKVAVDPVPITTPRSFNKVTVNFTASYPLTIAIVAKDYVESKSGLEYIGTSQQQIGDAGLIAQFHEKNSGKYVGGTSSSWKVLPIFQAPLNPTCEKVSNPDLVCKWKTTVFSSSWYSKSYVDKTWARAKEFSESAVGVKDGYLEVNWNPAAKLIWSSNLKIDNTVLFRTQINAAAVGSTASGETQFSLTAPYLKVPNMLEVDNTCDGMGVMPTVRFDGVPKAAQSLAIVLDTIAGPPRPGEPLQTDFSHLIAYNIDPHQLLIDANFQNATLGKNFKGTLGYVPPCSQGPGLKTYTFLAYALADHLTAEALTAKQLLEAMEGKILATAKLELSYTR